MKKQIIKIEKETLILLLNNNEINFNDNVKQNIINKLYNIISNESENNIDIDYADVASVIDGSEESYLVNLCIDISKMKEQWNQNIIYEAIQNNKIKNILLNFTLNSKMNLLHILEIMETINDVVVDNDESSIIFGTTNDESLENNVVEVMAVISV